MSSDVHFTCERSHALINSPVKFDAGLSSDAELMCELSLLRGLDQHRPHLPQLYHIVFCSSPYPPQALPSPSLRTRSSALHSQSHIDISNMASSMLVHVSPSFASILVTISDETRGAI